MDKNEVYIIWTTDNTVTVENMILMYSTNAMLNGWWDKVTVVLWGAAQELYLRDERIQDQVKFSMERGVSFSACRTCAVNLDAVEKLGGDGIEVIRWGAKLTGLMKDGAHILTF